MTSTGEVSWNFVSGAKTGTPGNTGSVSNWSAQTFTDSNTPASGTATLYSGYAFQAPTLVATNASVTTTNAATVYIPGGPTASTNQTITNSYAFFIDDGKVRFDPTATIVSSAGAVNNSFNITAQTTTVTGSTDITTTTGFNQVNIGQPTISASSALTVTNAATVYIENAPTGGGAGPATLTNAYALWIDAGNVRLDGDLTVGGDLTVTGGATITSGTITGITDLTIADGGTGASTASDAFANLKQNATASATGVVFQLRGHIDGCILAPAGSSADLPIGAGQVVDSTAAVMFNIAALTKDTASWVVGNGNGGLDTGTIANDTWYKCFAIYRSDTGVSDYIYTTSATPALPTDYTHFREIGYTFTDGSAQWIKFIQTGDEFEWDTPVLDHSANSSTTAALITLSVPTGKKVKARVTTMLASTGVSGANYVYISDPDIADLAPSATVAPLSQAGIFGSGVGGLNNTGEATSFTDTSAQVRIRSAQNSPAVTRVATLGWVDTRGKDG